MSFINCIIVWLSYQVQVKYVKIASRVVQVLRIKFLENAMKIHILLFW